MADLRHAGGGPPPSCRRSRAFHAQAPTAKLVTPMTRRTETTHVPRSGRARDGFDLVAPNGDALMDSFYARLFTTAPAVKPLWRARRATQRRRMSRAGTVLPVVLAASIALGGAPAVASARTQSAVPLARTVAVGADRGDSPWVRLYDAITGKQRSSFLAYPADFRGGVRIARGDVDGDGVADVITGPGPGASPHVKVFSGADGHLLRSFLAFTASSVNGVHVAAGDVNADRRADVIVGADAGGPPHVKVFDGATGALRSSFYAYEATFTGGVRVAAGDVDGDARADVITGTGPGASGHVKVFSGASGALIRSFLPYGPSSTAGVYVAAGRVDGDASADIIAGTGAGVAHVKAFSGTTSAVLMSFLPYGPSSTGGVRVAAGHVDGDARADVITAGGPHIKVFSGANASTLSSFLAGAPGGGAVFVAG